MMEFSEIKIKSFTVKQKKQQALVGIQINWTNGQSSELFRCSKYDNQDEITCKLKHPLVKSHDRPAEYGGVANPYCDDCKATIYSDRGAMIFHCKECGFDLCEECTKPSIRELMDVSKYSIRKIGFRVYNNDSSLLQCYYGIRLFGPNDQKIMEEEFCH